MPSTGNARKTTAGSVRGADVLMRALAGGGAAAVHTPKRAAVQNPTAVKKAERLLKQAGKALDERNYKAAETLFDETIALLDNPPSILWCYRLVAASKAANHEYVVNNYRRIRALASSDDELNVVDRSWIDCLVAAGHLHEALREVEILSRRNNDATMIATISSVIHARLGDLDKAIAIEKSALERDPSNATVRWNLAIHQMETGELPEAFDNYEARWQWQDFPSERRTFDIPRWKGEPPEGKRILAWREQGVGDEICFAGILPDLVAAGARITFECSPKLAGLFRLAFPEVEIRAEKAPNERKAEDYADFDFEVPVGSLARRFRPTAAVMQAKCRPWLQRDSEIESRLRADMNAGPQQPLIGLCWRSSNRNLHRNQNYIGAEYLVPLKLLGKSRFVCLQYDECSDEVAAMREMGLPIHDFPNIDQMNDLVSASYLTGACDLVISADTASGALAGGLGVPTIVFGRSPSMAQLGTGGVPWYPAARFQPLDADDPIGVARSILFGWQDIAAWAERASTSGRPTDWRLSFPGAA